jgi:hypothetical protein
MLEVSTPKVCKFLCRHFFQKICLWAINLFLVKSHVHGKLGQMTSKLRRWKFRHLSWITPRYDSQIGHYFVSPTWSLLLQAFYSFFKFVSFLSTHLIIFNGIRMGRQKLNQQFCKKKKKTTDFFLIQLKRNCSCDKTITH